MEREASESGRWEGGIDPKMSTAIVNYGECYLETRRDTLAHSPQCHPPHDATSLCRERR